MSSGSIFYVYVLFRLDGTPCYVGKGKGDRWQRHQGRSEHKNLHLGSIIDQARALGKELPRVKISSEMSEGNALELERILISIIGRNPHGPLVNLTDGGDGTSGYRYTPEQRERHGAIRRGRKHSPEWRAAISAGLKGKPKSPEHVKLVADAQRGGKRNHGWWSTEEGRIAHQEQVKATRLANGTYKVSEATRQKISATLLTRNAQIRSK